MKFFYNCVRSLFAIAENTIRDAVRQRFFSAVLILALLLAVSGLFFQEFDFGASELKFIADFGFGTVLFFGSVLTIVATTQVYFGEFDSRAVMTVLAKPMHRSVFIAGKFLGMSLIVFLFVLPLVSLLAAMLYWRETELMSRFPSAFTHGRTVDYGGIYLFGFLQWLKFCILVSIALFVASYANTNFYTIVVSFLVMLICQIQYVAHDIWSKVEYLPARTFFWVLSRAFPNFHIFNASDPLTLGELAGTGSLFRLIGYTLIYVSVLTLLSVFSFRQRDI